MNLFESLRESATASCSDAGRGAWNTIFALASERAAALADGKTEVAERLTREIKTVSLATASMRLAGWNRRVRPVSYQGRTWNLIEVTAGEALLRAPDSMDWVRIPADDIDGGAK